MKIKDFFNSINREIHGAHTEKALKILNKRILAYRDSIMRDEIKGSLKKQTLQEVKRTRKLIEMRAKQI